ncbi:MAG: hypothetical protein AAF600_22000 [Bacteroidota bacterium]
MSTENTIGILPMSTSTTRKDLSGLNKLSTEELGKLFSITIESCNPSWIATFEDEKS